MSLIKGRAEDSAEAHENTFCVTGAQLLPAGDLETWMSSGMGQWQAVPLVWQQEKEEIVEIEWQIQWKVWCWLWKGWSVLICLLKEEHKTFLVCDEMELSLRVGDGLICVGMVLVLFFVRKGVKPWKKRELDDTGCWPLSAVVPLKQFICKFKSCTVVEISVWVGPAVGFTGFILEALLAKCLCHGKQN